MARCAHCGSSLYKYPGIFPDHLPAECIEYLKSYILCLDERLANLEAPYEEEKTLVESA